MSSDLSLTPIQPALATPDNASSMTTSQANAAALPEQGLASAGLQKEKESAAADPSAARLAGVVGTPMAKLSPTDAPFMLGDRSRNAKTGRLRTVRADETVANNPTLTVRTPELAAQFPDLTVGELREMFGGRSVSQIGKLHRLERQWIVFDYLVGQPDSELVNRALSVRVPTKTVVGYLEYSTSDMVRAGDAGYSGKIDPKLAAKNFPPDLLALYQQLREGQSDPVTTGALSKAYQEQALPLITQIAGTGTSAKWVSLKEARKLPEGIRRAYQQARHRVIYSDRYDRAYMTPFPDGVVDDHFALRNYFKGIGARTMASVVEKFAVFERFQQLKTKAVDGPVTLSDGTTVTFQETLMVDGKKLTVFRSKGPYLVFRQENRVLVASVQDFWSSFQLHIHVLPDISRSTMQHSETHYSSRSIMEEIDKEVGKRSSRSAVQNIVDRLEGDPDMDAFARLTAWLADAAGQPEAGQSVRGLGAAAAAEQSRVVGEYFHRKEAARLFSEIAEMVPLFDEVCLGDYDLSISVADTFDYEFCDWDTDQEWTETLVADQGPLLIFQSHCSGADFVVDLTRLAAGDLRIQTFYDGSPKGVIEIDGQGKPGRPCNQTFFERVAFEMEWAHGELKEMVRALGEKA